MPFLALGAAIVGAAYLVAKALSGNDVGGGSSPGKLPNKGEDPAAGGGAGGSGTGGSRGTTVSQLATTDGSNTGQTVPTGSNLNEMNLTAPGATPASMVAPRSYDGGPYTVPGGYTTNYRVTTPSSVPAAAIAPGAKGRILE